MEALLTFLGCNARGVELVDRPKKLARRFNVPVYLLAVLVFGSLGL